MAGGLAFDCDLAVGDAFEDELGVVLESLDFCVDDCVDAPAVDLVFGHAADSTEEDVAHCVEDCFVVDEVGLVHFDHVLDELKEVEPAGELLGAEGGGELEDDFDLFCFDGFESGHGMTVSPLFSG